MEKELKNLRKKCEKHFLQDDGTIIAKMYKENIHYLKDGIYEEIDNTLIKKGNIFQNKSNEFKASFHEKDKNKLLEMERDGHTLSMSFKNECEVCPNVKNTEISYQDLLDKVDVTYKVLSNKVKEAVVLKENKYKKLEFVIETDLELSIKDKTIEAKNNNETIFVIEAPYMIDTNKIENHNIYYTLEKHSNHYDVTLYLDTEWLEKAKFPVIVDPTIMNHENTNNVYDTYIFPNDTGIDRNSRDCLKMGVERINNQDIINRALLKFELPTIGTGSQIIDAEMDLIGYPVMLERFKRSKDVVVHRVTQDWDEQTASWNTMHDKYDERIEDYNPIYMSVMNSSEIYEVRHNYFNITNLVKMWYSGTPNYGIMVKSLREIYDSEYELAKCFSKDNAITGYSPKPVLVIHYRNQNGLESYMDYQTQSFTDGTTFGNLYNGNLVASFQIGKTISGKFPASLSLVYNTNDVILKHDYGYGLGYTLNLHQMIRERNIDEQELLEYQDGDGTLHYFYKGGDLTNDYPEDPENPKVVREENTYYDEDGLSLKINKIEDNYEMTDNNSNTSLFVKKDSTWYLKEITDTSNNKIQIEYDTSNRIVKVIDGNKQEISLMYEQNKIVVSSSNETVTMLYTDKQLSSLMTKNGTTEMLYQEKLLSKVTDVSGKSIIYEYYNTLPYRLKKMTEYGFNQGEGKHIEFAYGFNSTTIKDNKGDYFTYTFNNNGNTIGVTTLNQKEDIKDAFGKTFQYGSKNNYTTSFGSMNKLISETGNVKYVKNYLENSSFEDDRLLFNKPELLSFSSLEAATGNRSLFINGNFLDGITTVEQSISVPKGKDYTFSAYLKLVGYMNMILSYVDVGGQEVKSINKIEENSDFERHDITIFYPKDATSDLKIKFEVGKNTQCYIDDIQLEEGKIANLYNLIDNSDFSKGLGGFEAYVFVPDSDEVTDINPLEVVTFSNGNTALKWHTEPDWNNTLRKRFPISGKVGDVYTLNFWYKNTGIEKDVPGLSQGKALIRFDYIDPEPSCIFPRGDYSANNTEWQFFEETFRAEYDYTGIELVLFDSHANDLYLTNFSLYKPVNIGSSYIYDDNGNVTTVHDPLSGPKELSYDKNNQLVGMLDVKGSNFVYEYDNEVKDRVLKGVSATGISNEIDYDEFGNPVITKITNINTREDIEGIYYIRMKGTKKYFDNNFYANMISLREDCCSHDGYNFIKEDNYYKIVPIDNPNYSIYCYNECVLLSKHAYSLFELIKNKNGSYMFKLKQEIDENEEISGVEEQPKIYVTFDNEKLVLEKKEMENPNQNFYLEESGNHLFVANTAEYTEDGKYITSTKDTLGRTTTYDIDTETGLTNSITDSKGVSVNYTYNNKEQLTKVEKDGKKVEYEYNDKNLLSKIKHGTKEYNFTYDEFLNTKTIGIGNNLLITNNYEENNGNLLSSTYGNNDTISYEYDSFDRIKTIHKMNDSYTNYYDNLGNVAKIESNNDTYRYQYDLLNRLTDYKYNDKFKIKYRYDETSNVKDKYYDNLETSQHLNYEYNKDNAVTKIVFDNSLDTKNNTPYQDKLVLVYTYDELGRMTEKKLNNAYKTNYHYIIKGKRTSFVLDKLKDDFNEFEYKYDLLDNITDIYKNGDLVNHYEYDNSNQLIKEDVYESGITTIYSYDNVGNIISKKDYRLQTERLLHEDVYEYNNPNWEDQLTKFNNETITYDEIGNPLTIGSKTLTWINGRQLESIVDSSNTITYEYNKDGTRTKKTVNGQSTTYLLENNNIIFEESPKGMIYYKRDENNHLIGFRYNEEHYYYLKNAGEDIIGIMDSNYNVIANYKYDAYGNINLITDNNGLEITDLSHVAYINPFRYRSYYYDEETKLYYLNSRYYNPLFGRFINADGTIGSNDDIISHNLFAYVSNNPINRIDVNGNFSEALPLVGGYLGKAASASASTGTSVGLFAAGIFAIGSLLCYGIYELTKPKTQTIVLPEVRPVIPNNDEYVYRPAYVDKSTGVLVTTGSAMNFESAKRQLTVDKGLNAIVNNQKIMGIYTPSQEHAKALAIAAGADRDDLPKVHNSGYYGHYHDKFHRAHIWYGGPVTWDE